MHSKKVATGAYETHVLEAGHGHPLVLIHGGGAGADAAGNWGKIVPRYVAAGFHVIAYDLVGFGESTKPDPAAFNYDQANRNLQLQALLDALGLDRVSIIGNSMGGATALGLAMAQPERIAGMVLMASGGVNHDVASGLSPLINYDFTVEGMRQIVAALTNPDFEIDESMVKYRHALSSEPRVRASYSAVMGWIKQQGGLHYDEADIARVKSQTLVVSGKNDQVIPIGDSLRLMELLDNAHGYFIPNCGHWAMIEYPELFAEVTIPFLARTASAQ